MYTYRFNIINEEEFTAEMERRGWNGQAYLDEVEKYFASNSGSVFGADDLTYDSNERDGGYSDFFELVEPELCEIVNEETGETLVVSLDEYFRTDKYDGFIYAQLKKEPVYKFVKG